MSNHYHRSGNDRSCTYHRCIHHWSGYDWDGYDWNRMSNRCTRGCMLHPRGLHLVRMRRVHI